MVPGDEPIQPPWWASPENQPSLTHDHSWKILGAVLAHHPFPCSFLGGDSWKCPWGAGNSGRQSYARDGRLAGWPEPPSSEDSRICRWSVPPALPLPPSWSHPGSLCVCPTPRDSGLTLKALGPLPGASLFLGPQGPQLQSQPGLRAISGILFPVPPAMTLSL